MDAGTRSLSKDLARNPKRPRYNRGMAVCVEIEGHPIPALVLDDEETVRDEQGNTYNRVSYGWVENYYGTLVEVYPDLDSDATCGVILSWLGAVAEVTLDIHQGNTRWYLTTKTSTGTARPYVVHSSSDRTRGYAFACAWLDIMES